MLRGRSVLPLWVVLAWAGVGVAAETSTKCPTPKEGESRPWLDPSYTPECRARFVLAELQTLEEKIDFISRSPYGGREGWPERFGLRRGSASDGPAGIRSEDAELKVTTFPSPLTVGASFDPRLAARFGDLLGEEFAAAGRTEMLGPAMDMARNWQFGRVTESFGEEPFLTASMVAPEIEALQSHHVISQMKHFAVYVQEQGRTGDSPLREKPATNFAVSEKALREVYLPAFRAAVERGGAGDTMCSFASINGTYACEHPHLLGILKNEWGQDGTVGPDYPDAQRSIIAAVLAGLDFGIFEQREEENPMLRISNGFGGESLKAAVEAKQVPESRIDDMVLRRLRPGFRLGVFDQPTPPPTQEVSTPERRAKLVGVVTGGSVLLKNDGNILPLGPEVRSVAIIGAQAGDGAVIQQVGSANSIEAYRSPVVPALRERAGDSVTITYAQGDLGLARLPDLPATMLQTPSGEPGLRAEYYANPRRDFSGEPLAVRTEPGVSVMGKPDVPDLPGDRQYSVRWSGVFLPSATGVQKLTLEGGGSAALYVDDRKVASFEKADIGDIGYANLPMEAEKPVPIRVEWTPREALMDGGAYGFGSSVGTVLKLGWSAPDRLIEEAAAAAAKADVAVVFASHRVGEGMDRLSLALPNDQDALIQAVARANPRTVVVLNTGGPVTMPWLGDVAAVLEMWLPGSVQGPATARLLFGDAEPQGRLPVTFPADESQGPSATPRHYPGTRRADGSLDTAYLEEGVNVGYRYYDVHDQKPLLPFGYGLSYTTFAIEGLGARARPDGSAVVDVSVRNTGRRAGAEVVQVYLGFPEGTGEPPKLLRGFQKVELAPGEQKQVGVCLPPRTFEHWDEEANVWRVAGGRYQVMVGRSSRDLAYTTDVEIAGRAGGGAATCETDVARSMP